jgi:hypothetical protein
MRKIFLIISMMLIIASSNYGQAKQEILTNKNIIDLTNAGLGNDVIISQINASAGKFTLTTNDIIALKKSKVTDEVITAMINKGGSKKPVVTTEPAKKMEKEELKTGLASVQLMNHVYFQNKKDQTVKPLEKLTAGIRTKQGVFGGSAMLQVDGAKSPIRLTPEEANSFVINTGSATLPELILYKLKSTKGGKREVASMKVNSFSGVKTGEDVVPFNITKLKEGIYQISPTTTLEKGEFFFTGKPVAGSTSVDSFCFGVD